MNAIRFGLRRAALFVLALTAAMPCVAQDGIVTRNDLKRIGYHPYWEVTLPLLGDEKLSNIYYAGDNLYAYTDQGNVIAVEAEAGLARWMLEAESTNRPVYPPSESVAADGRSVSVVTTTHDVYLVDLRDGDLLSQIHLVEFVNGSAAADAYRVYIPTLGERLISKFWYLPGILGAENAWQVATGDALSAKPIFLGENELCFASHDGGVFACTADRKVLIWSAQTGGAIEGELDADDEAVYAASMDRSLYRLNAGTGNTDWRKMMSAPLREGPVVISDTAYQYVENTGMVALDARSGDELWVDRSYRRIVTEHGDHVLLQNRGGKLLAVERNTGKTEETIDLAKGMMVAQNQVNPALFFARPNGQLLCAMPKDVPFLKAARVRDLASSMRNQPLEADERQKKLLEPIKDETSNLENEPDPIRSKFDRSAGRP